MRNLYDNYTFCCGGGMNIPINKQSSDDAIREYFLGAHNKKTLESFGEFPFHLVIPYNLNEKSKTTQVHEYFSGLKNIRQNLPKKLLTEDLTEFGINLPKLEEIVIVHAGLPVDTMSSEELKYYLLQLNYESLSFWKSAA